MPSERARLRRPGSEEGRARQGDLNSCWWASGAKPGGVGMNRGGEAALGQGMARPGLVGKRPAESSGKYLQEPVGHGREGGQPWRPWRRPRHGSRPLSPRARWGLSRGPRGGVH